MKSLVLLGLIIGCVVVVTSGCNYNKEMCRAQYEEGKAKGDCYEDLSSGFGEKVIKACVDVCHPRTGDAVKCEDFCPAFKVAQEGVCLAETSTVSTTTGIQPISSTDLPTNSQKEQPQKHDEDIPTWMNVLCAVFGTLVVLLLAAVVLLLAAVVYFLWERRNRNKEFVTRNEIGSLGWSTPTQQFGSGATLPEVESPSHPFKDNQSNLTFHSALPPSHSGTLQRSTAGWGSSGSHAKTSFSTQSRPFLRQPSRSSTVD